MKHRKHSRRAGKRKNRSRKAMAIDKARKTRQAKRRAKAEKRTRQAERRTRQLDGLLRDAFARRGYRGALAVLGTYLAEN